MIQRSPARYLLSLFGFYFLFSLIQRIGYATWVLVTTHTWVEQLGRSLVQGGLFDIVVGTFLFIPAALVFLLFTQKFIARPFVRSLLLLFSVFPFFIVVFSAVAEVFFFQEFQARFNFIAVDYLVYTHEVIQNIWESYPIVWIMLGLAALLLPLILYFRRRLTDLNLTEWKPIGRIGLLLVIVLFLGVTSITSEDKILKNSSYWTQEVSKNSIYTLFSAYFRNSIDFKDFYASMGSDDANHITHEWLEEAWGSGFEDPNEKDEDENSIIRNVRSPVAQKNWNVVFVVMESMSARFLAHYGNTQGLTPNLDRLADEGIFFSNLYATGTRTVRGLEALMLSLPPTPGQSILRRPGSDHIFNIGSVFEAYQYKNQFLYGGYGYFDNMKEWYSTNGFEVVDRSNFPKDEIEFTNAWGVSDEDLFKQVLHQADLLNSQNEKFFQVVMTTSNHRPYSYPSGRIDIPSKSGREGAVKYADYAIGNFIEQAKKKPWFDNTLFIFVADHNASVAGGTSIPVQDFLIPAIFYGPGLVTQKNITKLGSQIDLAPSLLGMMGFSYQSKFFGQNLFHAHGGRALMGTYQKVALMEPGKLTLLSPGKMIEELTLDPAGKVLSRKSTKEPELAQQNDSMKLTISIYQSASELFSEGHSKLDRKYSKTINPRSD